MNENEQVELVFLEFGLADSDEQLEKVVSRFLIPILLKLETENEAIKNKVVELLNHISKRLKSRIQVKLPIDSLLELYDRSTISSFVTNFAIIYIKMGFPRISTELKGKLAPTLFHLLEDKPKQHQNVLLLLLLNSIPHVKLPESVDAKKEVFNFHEKPKTTKILLDCFMDVLLLPYNVANPNLSDRPSTAPVAGHFPAPGPGLSKDSMQRFFGDASLNELWSSNYIEKLKLSILLLMENDLFVEKDIVCHLVVASTDTKHQISTNGDIQLKKRTSDIDWDQVSILQLLYRLYIGDPAKAPKKRNMTPQKYDNIKRTHGSLRLKMKILSVLQQSKGATERYPSTIQVIYDGLFSDQTTNKLQILTLQFVHTICDKCEVLKLQQQAPLLLDALLKMTMNEEADTRIKSLAYTAVGKLSMKLPSTFSGKLQLLKDNFKALQETTAQDLKLAIQECLAMMSKAFKNTNEENANEIEKLINQYINVQCHLCRLCAIRYAGVVFPSNHIPTRHLLLLASTDAKEDVSIEARKLISMEERNEDKEDRKEEKEKAKLPPFAEMLIYTHEKAKERKSSSLKHSVGNQSIAYNPTMFVTIIKYLRKCLLQVAVQDSGIDLLSFRENEEQAPVIAQYVRKELKNDENATIKLISMYLNLSMQLLKVVADVEAMYVFSETLMILPQDVSIEKLFATSGKPQDGEMDKLMTWMKSMMFHTRDMVREYSAEVYADLLKQLPVSEDVEILIAELVAAANNPKEKYEKRHGSTLLLGYLIGDYLQNNDPEMMPQAINDAIRCLVNMIENENDKLLVGSACSSLGEIGRKSVLPIPDGCLQGGEDERKKIYNPDEDVTKETVSAVLLKRLCTSSDHKIRDKSALALGRLPIGDHEFPHTKHILTRLMDTSKTKSVDLQFTIGQALCNASLGVQSSEKYSRWTYMNDSTEQMEANGSCEKDHVEWLIEAILTSYVHHKNESSRQASCVWLMTILKSSQLCAHKAVRNKLPAFQNSFMNLLTEQDDLTQDIASKGLGVVYELGTSEQKQQLVSNLVSSLTDGQTSSQTEAQRDILKESGGFGKAPDGSKLSTYKELCSLANDLNQPDLVYKFLHLSRHNAVWNTKKGAAFGFSTIVSLASKELEPHMPVMVPRLYRYTFDPQVGVRHAMTEIWHAIAPDPKAVVDKYLKEIVEDLASNLTTDLWRTRQASCLELADLLKSGRGFRGGNEAKIIISALPDFWYKTMRAMDDIKETVRDAAVIAGKSLKTITMKFCDPVHGKLGQEAIVGILPTLIDHGLQSHVKYVAKLSLSTLSEISKKSGSLIKPCIPEMFIALLEALLNFEPKELNYLSVRSDSRTRDAIDDIRASHVTSSPMIETIDRCLPFVDEEILQRLMPLLNDFMKRSISVMCKVGYCHVVIKLVEQSGKDLTPFAGGIVTRLTNGLTNSSFPIRRYCANCLGHVLAIVKDTTLQKTLNKLKSWYLENEDETLCHASALAFAAIAKYCHDVTNNNLAFILPLAFFGMHEKIPETDESHAATVNAKKKEMDNLTPNLWKKIWNEFTPGIASAITLYLTELLDTTSNSLSSQQWKIKAQGAEAMATIARKHKPGTISGNNLHAVIEVLQVNLRGRTWDGKEQLLVSLCAFALHCKDGLAQDEITKMIELLFKECKRDTPIPYKVESISTLSKILKAHNVDKFQYFWEIIEPIISKDSKQKLDDDDEGDSTTYNSSLLECAVEACGTAWLTNTTCTKTHLVLVLRLLSIHVKLNLWSIQLKSLKSINSIMSCVKESNVKLTCEEIETFTQIQLLEALCVSLENTKYSRIKQEAFEITKKLTEMFSGVTFSENESLKSLLHTLTTSYTSKDKQELNEILQSLKSCTKEDKN